MINHNIENNLLEMYTREIFEIVGLKIDNIKFYLDLTPRAKTRVIKPDGLESSRVEVRYPMRLRGHYSEILLSIAVEAVLEKKILENLGRIHSPRYLKKLREEAKKEASKILEIADSKFEVRLS